MPQAVYDVFGKLTLAEKALMLLNPAQAKNYAPPPATRWPLPRPCSPAGPT